MRAAEINIDRGRQAIFDQKIVGDLLAAQHSTQLSAVHECCPYAIAEFAGRSPKKALEEAGVSFFRCPTPGQRPAG